MNFPHRAFHFAKNKAHLRSHTRWISGRAVEPDAQTGFCADVMKQLRLSSILGYNQIDPAILVVVAQRGPTLFAIDIDAGVLAPKWRQFSRAIAPQP